MFVMRCPNEFINGVNSVLFLGDSALLQRVIECYQIPVPVMGTLSAVACPYVFPGCEWRSLFLNKLYDFQIGRILSSAGCSKVECKQIQNSSK